MCGDGPMKNALSLIKNSLVEGWGKGFANRLPINKKKLFEFGYFELFQCLKMKSIFFDLLEIESMERLSFSDKEKARKYEVKIDIKNLDFAKGRNLFFFEYSFKLSIKYTI